MLSLLITWVALISIVSPRFLTYYASGTKPAKAAPVRHHNVRFGKMEYRTLDRKILPRPRVLNPEDIVWFKLDMTRTTAKEASLSNEDIKELKCFFSADPINQNCEVTSQNMNSVDTFAVHSGQPDGVSLILRCDSPQANGGEQNELDCDTYPWWLATWVEVETGDASHPLAWQLIIGHKREGDPPRWKLPDSLGCDEDARWKDNPHCSVKAYQ